MRWSFLTVVVGAVFLGAGVGWADVVKPAANAEAAKADAGKGDELAEKGLVKSGPGYVLAGETELLAGIKELRLTKRDADIESRQRQAAERKLAENRKIKKDSIKEYEELERRLPNVKNPTAHNRLVARLNLMVRNVKDAEASEKDLLEQANQIGSEAKTKFVDDLAVLGPKFDAATLKYNELGRDGGVKLALDKLSAGGGAKVTMGPSAEFAAAVADLDRWRSEITSEAIPMRDENGIHTVEVIINGERVRMVVDTGASHITLPWETAEKLKVTPGEKDPDVQMKLASGAIISGKQITLKSVRLGRFKVDEVTCIVMEQGLPDPATMLGSSFLSHFVVKMNQQRGELHLTEVTDGSKKAAGKGP